MKTINFDLEGSKGTLSCIFTYPSGEEQTSFPVAVLMHGFMANKKLEPLKSISKKLSTLGIASIRFDFNGHGKSDGKFSEMTVLNEIEDAKKVLSYVRSLPQTSKIGFLGHSQGGVVAGMLAGHFAGTDSEPACLVQLAPAAVLKDDALNGVLMNKKYDPQNPPEILRVMFHKVGKQFFTVAQTLPIYEESAGYCGPVCLIHGTNDKIVPVEYSKRYKAVYKNCELHIIEKENHILSKHRAEIIDLSCSFLAEHLKGINNHKSEIRKIAEM